MFSNLLFLNCHSISAVAVPSLFKLWSCSVHILYCCQGMLLLLVINIQQLVIGNGAVTASWSKYVSKSNKYENRPCYGSPYVYTLNTLPTNTGRQAHTRPLLRPKYNRKLLEPTSTQPTEWPRNSC